MDTTIFTPRLKLTLITTADRGSPEFEWIHQLRSDEKSTWWSISPRSKTPEDTEKAIKGILPATFPTVDTPMDGLAEEDGKRKAYRVAYAVHEILQIDPGNDQGQAPGSPPTTCFIGLITLVHVDAHNLVLPDHLSPSASETTLIVELAYSFLPVAWGKGYATESVNAVFASCSSSSKSLSFWTPFTKVYVRAIVNGENPASLRVMDKTSMVKRGVFELNDRPVFLAGKIREHHVLHIYGMYLVE